MRREPAIALVVAGLLATACSASVSPESISAEEPPATSASTSSSTHPDSTDPTSPAQAEPESEVDLTQLPLGDGKVSTSPQRGYIYACRTQFPGGGPAGDGPWIDQQNGTWDATSKVAVDGEVAWSSSFTITVEGDTRVLTGNGLPDHTTGEFPISPDDEAYQYDRNPNEIDAQTVEVSLPATPTVATEASCTSGGPIGVLLTGAVVYNGFDAAGRDAVAHEVQDECHGHPQQSGEYHYHDLTSCLDDDGTSHSALFGYALDGFGIYGVRGENGETLTNADLDECHGHTHAIEWDGELVDMYHYHATYEFPYTVSCYRGAPASAR